MEITVHILILKLKVHSLLHICKRKLEEMLYSPNKELQIKQRDPGAAHYYGYCKLKVFPVRTPIGSHRCKCLWVLPIYSSFCKWTTKGDFRLVQSMLRTIRVELPWANSRASQTGLIVNWQLLNSTRLEKIYFNRLSLFL